MVVKYGVYNGLNIAQNQHGEATSTNLILSFNKTGRCPFL